MNPFLRKVLAQREREMELELLMRPPEFFGPSECEGCGRRLNVRDDGQLHRFCTECGGMKRQRREAEAQHAG